MYSSLRFGTPPHQKITTRKMIPALAPSPAGAEDYDPLEAVIRPLNQLPLLPPARPREQDEPRPTPVMALDQWLNAPPSGFRKVVLCNRYFWLTSITNNLIPLIRRPYFVVSEHLQHIPNARSSFSVGATDPAQPQYSGMHPNAFDSRYVDPGALILYEGNFNELERLENWQGDVIFIVGFGLGMDKGNYFTRMVPSDDIIRIMWPNYLELQFVREDTEMSEYQKTYYRARRSHEIAVGTEAKQYLAQEATSPIKRTYYGKKGQPLKSPPQKGQAYKSDIMVESKERGNLVYPQQIQQEYEKTDKRFRDKSIARPDLPQDQKGWMTPEVIPYLNTYSPKTVRVIARLLARSGGQVVPQTGVRGKFIIASTFRDHHGIFWLSTILSYYGIPSLLLHGKLGTTDNTKALARQQVSQNFNSLESGVLLVTNELKLTGVYFNNVDEIIFFDGATPRSVYEIVGSCFHDTQYTTARVVQVVFEISRRNPTQGSADSVDYKTFMEEETKRGRGYEHLLRAARPVFMGDGGFTVGRYGK